jgi:hypothetical protein
MRLMKSLRIGTALTVFLAACGVVGSPLARLQALNQPARPAQQSVTEDLSGGRSFTFTIAPNLPVFHFKLIPDAKPPDQYGNAESTIRDIEVYRGDTTRALQHLTGCDLDEMEPPGRGAEFFIAEDVNFDGYKDIFLETGHGATGNESGCVWLFSPVTGSFDYSKDLSGLDRFWLDPSTKTILTYERGGMLGLVYGAGIYAVLGDRPVLIRSEFQDWDDAKKQFHCIVKRRRGSEMIVVRDVWGKNGEDDAPCDPNVLFKHFPPQQ